MEQSGVSAGAPRITVAEWTAMFEDEPGELGLQGHYVYVLRATDGVVVEVPGCPGLSLDLDDLWCEFERLGPKEPSPS